MSTVLNKLMVCFPSEQKRNRSTENFGGGGLTAAAAPSILAYSVSREFLVHRQTRKKCEDRRPFLDQFKTRQFCTSVARVTCQQGCLVISNYLVDQMEYDMKLDEKVAEGKMSRDAADDEASRWEKETWEIRWKAFPPRLMTAFAKYHVVVFLTRTFEYFASKMCNEDWIDKLTKDTFKSAKMSRKNETLTVGSMFQTCFWASLLSYMADYGLHQVLIFYAFYRHADRQRKKRKKASDEEETENAGAMGFLYLKRSVELVVSRSLGLFFSSVGGAVGSVVYPGWGTVVCANMGDALADRLTDKPSDPASDSSFGGGLNLPKK